MFFERILISKYSQGTQLSQMIYTYTTIGIINFVSRGLIIFLLFLLLNIEIHSIEILINYMDVYLHSIVYNMILQ